MHLALGGVLAVKLRGPISAPTTLCLNHAVEEPLKVLGQGVWDSTEAGGVPAGRGGAGRRSDFYGAGSESADESSGCRTRASGASVRDLGGASGGALDGALGCAGLGRVGRGFFAGASGGAGVTSVSIVGASFFMFVSYGWM